MKPRKRTDTYPITATLTSNGTAVNLAGYTVTLYMVDRTTRVAKITGAAVTITNAAAGQVSYTPSAADVNTSSTYDVEFKAIAGDGTVYHFPSLAYEPLYINDSLG